MKMQYKMMPFFTTLALVAGFDTFAAEEQVDLTKVVIPAEFNVWGGLRLNKDYMSPLPDDAAKAGAVTNRPGSPKAAEYRSLDSSPSGGFLYSSVNLPHRMHFEADIENGDEWYGDFRYSYLDMLLFRFQPVRGYHNTDNIQLHDYQPTINAPTTGNSDVQRLDIGREYGITTDTDKYFLRLKPKNYPIHVYDYGEVIKQKGDQQQRFLGGAAAMGGLRVSEARGIDMETRENTFGGSAHLGPVEIDFSHTDSSFGADTQNPMYYDYLAYTTGTGRTLQTVRAAGLYPHNIYPDLKASTNTFRIHTAQTGSLFGSATLSRIERENEFNGVEAVRQMGYAEIFWRPMTKLAFSGQLRTQQNDDNIPSPVFNPGRGMVATRPGVRSDSNSMTALVKYSPLSKLTLNGKYDKRWITYEDGTATQYWRPEEIITDTYELNATWRLKSSITITGGVEEKENTVKKGIGTYKYIDPQHATQGFLSTTWMPTEWLTALLRADVTSENSDNIKLLTSGAIKSFIDDVHDLDIFRHTYLASFTFTLSDTLSITPIYTFNQLTRDQDVAKNATMVNKEFSEEEVYHNFMVEATYVPTDRIILNASVEYTTGRGDYTDSMAWWTAAIDYGLISQNRINEVGYRLEGNYALDDGWSTGMDLQYIKWKDESFDNPAEGTFFSTLLKVAKKF